MKAGTMNWKLGTLITLAVLIRVVTAAALGDVAEPVSGAYDQVSYDGLAQRVAAGYGFSFPTDSYPFARADQPTAHWSFLYTSYLAFVYAVMGHHPLAARLIQVLLSGLHIWLIYRLALRLFDAGLGPQGEEAATSTRRPVAALAAAALTAFYAYFIFFNATLMTQTFYIICLLAALNIALDLAEAGGSGEAARRRALPRWAALGLVLGLGALLRQTLLLFVPVLLAWLWWARRNAASSAQQPPGAGSKPPALAGMLVAVSVMAALVIPWTVRNYLAFNDFLLLNSNGGYWLYSSNHPDQGVSFDADYVAPLPEELKGLREPAIDRGLYQRGLGFILVEPGRFLLLSVSRMEDYFWILPTEESLTISNLARLVSFGLYLPFMLYGLWLSRRRWRVCLPLYLYVAFDTTLHLATWAAPRYRLPSDAVMIVFAAWALTDLGTRLAARLRESAPAEIPPREAARALHPTDAP